MLKGFDEGWKVERGEGKLRDTKIPTVCKYADMVLNVDNIPDPFDALIPWGNDALKTTQRKRSESLYLLFHQRGGSSDSLRVAHENRDHFQGRGQCQFWFWHDHACMIASGVDLIYPSEERLWIALMLNAYADHFLQDSYAPGHAITPRDHLHDLPSLAMHDYYNKVATKYQVKNVEELPFCSKRDLALLAELNDTQLRASAEELRPRIVRLLEHLTNPDSKSIIEIQGDNRLYRDRYKDANETKQMDFEATFISLVCARSIIDITSSYLGGHSDNQFSTYHWFPRSVSFSSDNTALEDKSEGMGDTMYLHRPNHLHAPESGNAFGEYRMMDTKEIKDAQANAVSGAIALSSGFSSPIGHAALSPRFDLALETVFDGDPGSMTDFLVDRVKWRNPYSYKVPEWALVGGILYTSASRDQSWGIISRFVFPIPSTDSQLSFGSGYSMHENGRGAGFYNARIEQGIGLGFLYLGIGYDHYMQRSGNLRDGWMLSAGLELAGPASRALKVIKDIVPHDPPAQLKDAPNK